MILPKSTSSFTSLLTDDLKECGDPTMSHLLHQIAKDEYVTLARLETPTTRDEKFHFFCGCIVISHSHAFICQE